MANLTETPNWENGIYQWETTDPAQGGASGIMNTPTKQLANRTSYLKQEVERDRLKTLNGTDTDIELDASNPGTAADNVVINKADGYYGRKVNVTREDQDVVNFGSITLSTSDMTVADKGVVVRFVGSSIIDGDATNGPVQIKVGSTVIGRIRASFDIVDVVFNGTTWVSANFGTAEFIGSVAAFGMSTPPAGWLVANGAAISRATYAELFAKIGTTFGAGNGTTTFNLPDLRGEFIRGWDNGRGVDSGRVLGSAQAATGISLYANGMNGSRVYTPAENFDGTYVSSAVGGFRYNVSSWTAVSSEDYYRVRPRNVAMLMCIKF